MEKSAKVEKGSEAAVIGHVMRGRLNCVQVPSPRAAGGSSAKHKSGIAIRNCTGNFVQNSYLAHEAGCSRW